jgi:hypothetical protein
MADKKLCPLKTSQNSLNPECDQEKCAWWDDVELCCCQKANSDALSVIHDTLRVLGNQIGGTK